MAARYITAGQSIGQYYRARMRRLRKELTATERLLWNALRHHKLHALHFRRQQAIGSYIVDFICLAAGVGVEVDGAIHQRQRDYDIYRDEYLTSHQLLILRFTNDQVNNDLPGVLLAITKACTEHLTMQSVPE